MVSAFHFFLVLSMAQERKVYINGVNINYLKIGTGSHHVLLTPGIFGSIWTDFKKQIDGFDKTKFTLVVWDPPGYGKSRPPDRDFSCNFFERDADFAWNLMKKLNIEKYSLVGWSNGGIVSMILTAAHPENVYKLVAFGSNSYFTPEEIYLYKIFGKVDYLNPKVIQQLIELYGKEHLEKMIKEFIDVASRNLNGERKGDICKSALPKISCPTLVLHGGRDLTVSLDHAPYLHKNIKNSRFCLFKEAKHNLHISHPEEFNKIVQEFLLESESKITENQSKL